MRTYKIDGAVNPAGLSGWTVTLVQAGELVREESFFNEPDEEGDEAFEECVCAGEIWCDGGDERQEPVAVDGGRWPWVYRVGQLYAAELISNGSPDPDGMINPQPWTVIEPVLQAWTTDENRAWIEFNRETADRRHARFSTLPKWPAQRC
jgi:hypothetical protein